MDSAFNHLRFRKKFVHFIQISALLVFISLKSVFAEQAGFELNEQFKAQNTEKVYLQVFAEITPSPVSANSIMLSIFGRIEPNYHIYSIHKQGEFSPEPTKLKLHSLLTKESDLTESSPILIIDEAYGQSLKVHKNDFWLKCRYSLSEKMTSGTHLISGVIQYQICDNNICSLPLEKVFEAQLKID